MEKENRKHNNKQGEIYMKAFIGILAVGIILVAGYGMWSGNLSLTFTDNGKKNIQRAKDTAEKTIRDTGSVVNNSVQGALDTARQRIHKATE